MDVEYVVLETNDEFVNQGVVLDIGKKFILVKNQKNDGYIFVYNRNGKALRKINHKGQGAEEYTEILGITLDEDNEEMFVNDVFKKKIFVYDVHGNFKRSIKQKEEKDTDAYAYVDIFNYDRDNLICYDKHDKKATFVLVSKQDGHITKDIKIPFKEKLSLLHRIPIEDGVLIFTPGLYRSIIPNKGSWILSEVSSDTVYTLLPDNSLSPFIVKTPTIQSMNPEVVLMLRLLSDRYIFMEAIENSFDTGARKGFDRNFFVYDKQEKSFSGYYAYNGDYSTKKEIYLNSLRPVNHEIDSWQTLEAHELVESYEKGELKGKLKEIAAKLDEDDNPVIMLIKHKK